MNVIEGSKGKIRKGMQDEEENGKIRYVNDEKGKIREVEAEKAIIWERFTGTRTWP